MITEAATIPRSRASSTSPPSRRTRASPFRLIKDPLPGAPVPPILPPQDGFLFLDKAKFAASFAADVDPKKARLHGGLAGAVGRGALARHHEPAWSEAQLVPGRHRRQDDPTTSLPPRAGADPRPPAHGECLVPAAPTARGGRRRPALRIGSRISRSPSFRRIARSPGSSNSTGILTAWFRLLRNSRTSRPPSAISVTLLAYARMCMPPALTAPRGFGESARASAAHRTNPAASLAPRPRARPRLRADDRPDAADRPLHPRRRHRRRPHRAPRRARAPPPRLPHLAPRLLPDAAAPPRRAGSASPPSSPSSPAASSARTTPSPTSFR